MRNRILVPEALEDLKKGDVIRVMCNETKPTTAKVVANYPDIQAIDLLINDVFPYRTLSNYDHDFRFKITWWHPI